MYELPELPPLPYEDRVFGLTPGESAIASGPNRLPKGTFSRISVSRFFCDDDDFTSTTGAAPMTVTRSVSPPTSSRASSVMICPSCSRACCEVVLNPESSAVTS